MVCVKAVDHNKLVGGLSDDNAVRYEHSGPDPNRGNSYQQREGRETKTTDAIVHRPPVPAELERVGEHGIWGNCLFDNSVIAANPSTTPLMRHKV
jgi:hypothetical protein